MITYEQIAVKAELDEDTAQRFCWYMRQRWAPEESVHCQVGYAMEWAMRFKHGLEFEASDVIGHTILRAAPSEAPR